MQKSSALETKGTNVDKSELNKKMMLRIFKSNNVFFFTLIVRCFRFIKSGD